jgi:hypothetical protein
MLLGADDDYLSLRALDIDKETSFDRRAMHAYFLRNLVPDTA